MADFNSTASDPELYVDPFDSRYNSSTDEDDKEDLLSTQSTSDDRNSDDEDQIPIPMPRQGKQTTPWYSHSINVSVISLTSIDQMTLKTFDKQKCCVYSNRYKQEFWVDNCDVYQYGGRNEYKRPPPSQVFQKGVKVFALFRDGKIYLSTVVNSSRYTYFVIRQEDLQFDEVDIDDITLFQQQEVNSEERQQIIKTQHIEKGQTTANKHSFHQQHRQATYDEYPLDLTITGDLLSISVEFGDLSWPQQGKPWWDAKPPRQPVISTNVNQTIISDRSITQSTLEQQSQPAIE
ncbi:unnamed protein product, partial [Didymodactylos carnosus]